MGKNREQEKIFVPLRDKCVGKLKLKRVENKIGEAMADVIGQNRNGASFWLELKYLDKWPARATTLPLGNAFEPGQLPFLRSWRDWGGHAFVLLRVSALYILIDPSWPIETFTTDALMRTAVVESSREDIIKYLENLT